MRTVSLSALFVLAMFILAETPARSADVSKTAKKKGAKASAGTRVRELTEEGQKALLKGLAFLARQQNKDGSWSANVGFKLNTEYRVTRAGTGHPGVTALAGMAFLAGGNTPGRGKYGKNVKAAVRYVLSCVNSEDGMITQNGTRMYSHAFGTLFLAEVYGMTRDEKVRTALEKATAFTWTCQNKAGGWRYAPYAQDSDMSITVCQVMALRAARNIGILVPKSAISRAVNYVLSSAITSGQDAGSFNYQFRKEGSLATRASFALTAAGLTTLYSAGLYSDEDIREHIRKNHLTTFRRTRERPPRIRQILDYIKREYPKICAGYSDHFFYFYGNYYAIQAMHIAGGKWWKDYFSQIQTDLVARQSKDGSWPIRVVGPNFSTAVACLILQIPYRYLPIFQR